MPYTVRRRKRCFQVYNKRSKRVHSKCTTKRKAQAQMRLLQSLRRTRRHRSLGGASAEQKGRAAQMRSYFPYASDERKILHEIVHSGDKQQKEDNRFLDVTNSPDSHAEKILNAYNDLYLYNWYDTHGHEYKKNKDGLPSFVNEDKGIEYYVESSNQPTLQPMSSIYPNLRGLIDKTTFLRQQTAATNAANALRRQRANARQHPPPSSSAPQYKQLTTQRSSNHNTSASSAAQHRPLTNSRSTNHLPVPPPNKKRKLSHPTRIVQPWHVTPK